MRMIIICLILLVGFVMFADEKAEEATAGQDEAVLQAHRFFAADYFNKCWELMDKAERTPEEDLLMIHMSHASRAHWQAVGTPDNWCVGEWQLSRAYSLLNRTEPGLVHAQECLRLCLENDIVGFNLGFAYEALARIQYLQGNLEDAKKNIELGKKAAKDVEEKDDKEYLLKELDSIIK